ncbi:MAG: HEAT repeat domain-containing protein [Nitrospirae bacterium]|nr:HEAT repeat domain-containing protein [Nitrospirota bacterium]
MGRRNFILGILATLVMCWGQVTWAEVRLLKGREARALRSAKTIYVDVTASTWKTRGRLLYDIEGSVRVKLASVGFTVVRTSQEPHLLKLFVNYREERGEPYGANQFGTVMTGDFRVDHHTAGPVFEVTVQETSHPTISGTPPYLDALQNFQTNPYYYFLGDLIWWRMQKNHEAHTVFIEALKEKVAAGQADRMADPSLARFKKPDHYMIPSQELYIPIAIRRTVAELVHAKDPRLVPVLFDLVEYPDVYVRVQAVNALGSFQAVESLALLQNLISNDPDIEVRQAAEAVLDALTTTPSSRTP